MQRDERPVAFVLPDMRYGGAEGIALRLIRNFIEAAFTTEHDLTYTLGGPLAAELDERFEEFWHRQGGSPAVPWVGTWLPPSPATRRAPPSPGCPA